jgi:hypothetical protein
MSGRASSEAKPTTETVGTLFEALGSWARAEPPSARLAMAKVRADLLSIDVSRAAMATAKVYHVSRPAPVIILRPSVGKIAIEGMVGRPKPTLNLNNP